MKKVFLLFVLVASMALTVSAQVGGIKLPTINITHQSADPRAQRTFGSGPWHAKNRIRELGTTQFADTLLNIGSGVIQVPVTRSGLMPVTSYENYWVLYSATFADSAILPMDTFTTTMAPAQAVITLHGQPHPWLPSSQVLFDYSAPGLTWMVRGRCAPLYTVCTDTVFITDASGIGSLDLPNAPGQVMPDGFIEFQIVGTPPPGINPVGQTASWNSFVAPNYTLPSTMITTSVVYVDSVEITVTDSLGTGGPAIATTILYDSVNTVIHQWSQQLITGPTTGTLSTTNLVPGAKHRVVRKLSTANVGQDTASVTFYTSPVPAATGTIDSTPVTKTTIDIYIGMQTNGSWAGSVIDSLVVFDGTTAVAKVGHPIGSNATGQYHVTLANLTAGTTHTFSGYLKNVFGRISLFNAFNVTTSPADPVATLDWGIADQYPAKTVWRDISYNVPVGTATYAMPFRKVYPSTTAWDTFPIGMYSGSGTFADITVTPLSDLSSYEFKLVAWNADGIPYENSVVKTVSTLAAQQPKVNDVTTDQVTTSSVSGNVIGEANGTNSEESHKLFQIVSGNANQLQASAITLVGTDAFTVPYSFPLTGIGYYEARGQVAKVGNINPHAFSRFFNNTVLGIKELTFDELRSQLISSAYDGITGQWLAEKMLPLDLLALYPGRPLVIVPDDPYYREVFKGKLYTQTK